MTTSQLDDDALFGMLDACEASIRKLDPHDLFDAKGGMDDDDDHILEPPYQVGRETVLVRRPEDLCCGIVANSRVCLDIGAQCTVKSHQQKPLKLPFGTGPFLGIRGTNAKNGSISIFKSPLLPVEDMDKDLIDYLLVIDSATSDLAGTFNMIANSGMTNLKDFKSGRDLSRTVQKRVKSNKTPAKVDQRTKIEDMIGHLMNMQSTLVDAMSAGPTSDATAQLLELGVTDPGSLDLIITMFKQHSIQIETLAKRLRNTIFTLKVQSGGSTQDISGINATLEGISNNLDRIDGNLGKRSADTAGLGGAPTLWGQALAANERLNSSEKLLGTIKDKLAKVIRYILHVQRNNGMTVPDFGSMSTNDTTFSFGANDDDTVMNEINGNQRIQDGFLHPPRGSGNYATEDEARGIRVTSGGNERGNNGGNHGGFNNGNGYGDSNGNGSGGNRGNEFGLLQEQIDDLKRRMETLEGDTESNGEILRFYGLTLHSPEDFGAMFEKYLGVGARVYFSCFTSPNYIIDAVFRVKNPADRDAKTMKILKDLGLRQQEMDAYFSADHKQTMPDIMTHNRRLAQHMYKTKVSETAGARFPAMPSGEDMGNNGDNVGLHQALISALNTVQTACTADINRQLKGAHDLLSLATQMLTISVNFVRDLFAFMAQTFQALKLTFDGEDQAWACVCNSASDLWEHHFLPLKSDMASVDFNDANNLGSLIAWTSLRMVVQAQKLSAVSLASHPTVSSSYIRFLIDHLSRKKSDKNSALVTQIKNLKSSLEDSKQEVVALKGYCKSIESRVDKLQGIVNSKKQK